MGEAFITRRGGGGSPCLQYVESGGLTGTSASITKTLEEGQYILFVHQISSHQYGNYSNKGFCSAVEFYTDGNSSVETFNVFTGIKDHYVSGNAWQSVGNISDTTTKITLTISTGSVTAKWSTLSTNMQYYDHVWLLYKIVIA